MTFMPVKVIIDQNECTGCESATTMNAPTSHGRDDGNSNVKPMYQKGANPSARPRTADQTASRTPKPPARLAITVK
jgi:hypothetical protein